jgi:hypothetical protein
MRHVGFNMPLGVYQDYADVAATLGVDLSAAFNLALAEFRPLMLLRKARHDAAMLKAAATVPMAETAGANAEEVLGAIGSLIHQLQGLAAALSKQTASESKRAA